MNEVRVEVQLGKRFEMSNTDESDIDDSHIQIAVDTCTPGVLIFYSAGQQLMDGAPECGRNKVIYNNACICTTCTTCTLNLGVVYQHQNRCKFLPL